MDCIEFYRDGSDFPFASVESSMVPLVGAKISILGQTWEVVFVTYALDHVDDASRRCMRANVELKPVK